MTAIVITAYNRAESLNRLLNNLLFIRTVGDIVPLVISIDNNGTPEVNSIAENFEWPYGPKEVIIHSEKKGLVRHFIWTGDQTEKYENIIFLEDDLFVSPEIYCYTNKLIDFYKDDDRIAAASLYNPILNEATGTRFYQIDDGFDVYFLQQPYWGHIWIRDKWKQFKHYLESYEIKPDILPSHIASWDESLKKIYVQFLIETGRTVITPRVSYVTNNGVPGLHSASMYQYQSPLRLRDLASRFPTLDESLARYDAFFEIEPDILKIYNPQLKQYDFQVDINGTRINYSKEFVLSTRGTKAAIISFTSLMKPTELGCVLSNSGEGLFLSRKEDVILDHTYIRTRRYKDIKKNYYIGFYASFYIVKDFFKMLFKVGCHK